MPWLVPALLGAFLVSVQADDNEIDNSTLCVPGLLLPVWMPQHPISVGERVARGTVYLAAMLYLFIGVSIVSDRFMNGIEMITSQEKSVKIKKKNGEMQDVKVRVWNETVANLTLMALGSSAPEILLSIIEIIAKNYVAGDLGPGTIVGSAAYNLFIIIALCVSVIPNGETRKIKQLRVFFITAFWSVFAYVWLYIILKVTSVGVVEVWEGVLTFLFFPATVLTSYIADRRLFIFKYLPRISKDGKGSDMELGISQNHIDLSGKQANDDADEVAESFEAKCREFTALYAELRKQYPDEDKEAMEIRAEKEFLMRGPKSRAFYRMQATKKMTGTVDTTLRKLSLRAKSEEKELEAGHEDEDLSVQKVFFEKDSYKFMEDVGTAVVKVVRRGGSLQQRISVDYATEDGTAEAGSDYVPTSGTLLFNPGVSELTISVEIIDDEEFEEDETFIIRLSNPLILDEVSRRPSIHHRSNSRASISSVSKLQWQLQLGSPPFVTVTILDDDHGGIFRFATKELNVSESVGLFQVKVVRYVGGKGRVALPYSTEDGTARGGKDFENTRGEIIFEHKEIEKTIPVKIIEEGAYEKNALFYVNLGEPRWIGEWGEIQQEAEQNGDNLSEKQHLQLMAVPQLGNVSKAFVRITENKAFKMIIEKMAQNANASVVQGNYSWTEQFKEAITLREENDSDEEDPPSCGEYIMHFLTVFWKILFAFVPPTGYCHGWLCFWGSLVWIGLLTAVIGDVASHFGCSIGLKDTITAITLVAMGTSLPDTFASKVSAIQDETADNSVGNVTGSNAVNVFLGLGVAWSIASIYHAWHGNVFYVNPGSLAFSVTIFCTEACFAIIILVLRRHKSIGGELGGPVKMKYITTALFVGLWVIYMTFSTLEVYKVIEGF